MRPERIDNYRIEKKLGEGGMGEVYLARDEDLERWVAIKVIGREHRLSISGQKRFQREALTAARLSHPAIVRIYHKLRWEEEGDLCEGIVMEYVEGDNLGELLHAGPPPLERALPWLRQIAEGLAYAHGEGIIHRDLKPGNIMITREGQAKILDFGLAKKLSESAIPLTEAGAIVGTLQYMSPEQADGREVDHRSDIFSLGILFYQVVTGQAIFRAERHSNTLAKVLTYQPPPVAEVDPRIPPQLSQLIERMLAKDRKNRPHDAGEVAAVLARLTESSDSSSLPSEGSPAEQTDPRATPTVVDRRRREEETPEPPDWAASTSSPTSAAAWSPRKPFRNRISPRIAWVGGGLLLIVAVLVAAFYLRASARPLVVVLEPRNLGEPRLAEHTSTAITEILGTMLMAGDSLRMPLETRLLDLRRELGPMGGPLPAHDLQRLRQHLLADFVIAASYRHLGGTGTELEVGLMLQNAKTGEIEETKTFTGPKEDLQPWLLTAAEDLRRKLGGDEISAQIQQETAASLPSQPEAAALYWRGLARLREAKARDATDDFEQALEMEPGFPLLHDALARSLDARGYRGKAKEASRRAVELAAKLPRAKRLELEARSHRFARDSEAESAAYRTLIQLFPDHIDYGLELARALVDAKQPAEALEVLDQLRELPGSPGDQGLSDVQTARVRLTQDAFGKAQALAARAASLGESSGAKALEARARRVEADALRELGQNDEALRALDRARTLFEQLGDRRAVLACFGRMAIIASEKGDYGPAIELFEKQRQIYREIGDRLNEARTSNSLANVLLRLGRHEEAIAAIDAALVIFEEEGALFELGAATLGKGGFLQRSKSLAQARESYEKALAIFSQIDAVPERGKAHTNLGEVFYWTGDLDNAQQQFEQALAIFEELEVPSLQAYEYLQLGRIHAARAGPDEARRLFDRAHELNDTESKKATAQLALARLEIDQVNLGEALKLVRQAEEAFWEAEMKDEATLARIVQAQALLEYPAPDLERVRELHREIQLHASVSTDFQVTFEAAILEARIAARSAAAAEAQETVFARLEQLAGKARAEGFLPYVLEIELAMAEIELGSGRVDAGRKRLEALARDAEEHGWRIFVRRAEALKRQTAELSP